MNTSKIELLSMACITTMQQIDLDCDRTGAMKSQNDINKFKTASHVVPHSSSDKALVITKAYGQTSYSKIETSCPLKCHEVLDDIDIFYDTSLGYSEPSVPNTHSTSMVPHKMEPRKTSQLHQPKRTKAQPRKKSTPSLLAPQVFHAMVTHASIYTPEVMRWVCDGEAFVIDKSHERLSSLLMQYFKRELSNWSLTLE